MDDAVDRAKAALARGNLITAYDVATAAIVEGDEGRPIRHQQLLALARMGDTERAMELFEAYGLADSPDAHERAIGARLLKDRALAAPAGERQFALEQAFAAYHAIYEKSGDSFPGINAATLALLAGREEIARSLAEALLADPAVAAAEDYYMAVTRAEALLILGRMEEVTGALQAEAVRSCRDFGARSSTWRQLAMIARDHYGLDKPTRADLLVPLTPPKAMHYCGHMFGADPDAEARLKAEIDAVLEEEDVGFAFGALASGGDILIAEAVLDRGGELDVVLPFDEEDFLEQSVRPGGPEWEARYRACIARAHHVLLASEMEFFGDSAQYGYGSRMAMGLARLRAGHLATEAIQLAIWDGEPSHGPAGTGADVAAWAGQGRTRTIDPGAVDRKLERPEPRARTRFDRALAAILFTDFKGFSTLKESALPGFWDGVMRAAAEVLDAHAEAVECRNSWGDALYAVTSSGPAAAQIALELQDRLAGFDYATLGLDGSGGMRIGAHYGPAYRTTDLITGRTTFYGTEVSKAARIEPVTPPGAVFVTEPFAAILALEARAEFDCRYVGRIPLAKKYGDYPMYRLTRAKDGFARGA